MKFVPKNIYGKVMAFLKVFLGGASPAMAGVFSAVALFLPVQSILLYIGITVFPVGGMAFLVLPKFIAMTDNPPQDPIAKTET
ncbi:major facilitator superfamily permease [mine drainage metagenome]|uniref:Major facilitator superfamily permease n=1 Tax=mine drainage metagenome TaxID=410659 RepID=T0YEK7_9ZZZZ